MKIKTLDIDDIGTPFRATVEMTITEMAFIAKVIGKMNDPAMREVMNFGAVAGNDIYDALTGCIFNRYWDGGVDDVR